ncbi:sigma-70 family RNA polymerase sigma factor [Peribacillus sp. R9-11]|uniref:sigma-70 family RNA polymerase sigma factor n=1 Tax=Peribacillus sp. R9-11 TaxID=3073271 RepID=UPI0028683B83|nr:sigma-70 family RNA polymerase sigma factor [Peribacillus sp. R9-11]WMX58713.1 sigma-70 family RNA polymerase sigma factor [Peribacillus sp. R9-11]
MINIIESNYRNPEDNDKAFLGLFRQYEQDIYKMAYVYVKNKDDALDIVQETAYQSFLKFNTLNDLKLFKTWIIKITINCAIDLLRKKKKVILLNKEVVEFISNSTDDIPLSLTLQDLLEELNEDEKTVLLLKYFQGYTFSEISEIINTPLSTVKSVLYRALQNLRKKTRRSDMYGQ